MNHITGILTLLVGLFIVFGALEGKRKTSKTQGCLGNMFSTTVGILMVVFGGLYVISPAQEPAKDVTQYVTYAAEEAAPKTESQDVYTGPATVDMSVKEYPVIFSPTPPMARVIVYEMTEDGEKGDQLAAGSGPNARIELPAGDYIYTVKEINYETYQGTINLPKNKHLTVALTPLSRESNKGFYEASAPPGGYTISAAEMRRECKELVKSRLKAPSTAKFPGWLERESVDSMGDDWFWDGWVDSQNSFGAMLRAEFSCHFDSDTGYINVRIH